MKNIYVLTLAMVEAGVHAVFLTCPTIPTLSCRFPLLYHTQCSFRASAPFLSLQGSSNRTCKICLKQSFKGRRGFVWRSDGRCKGTDMFCCNYFKYCHALHSFKLTGKTATAYHIATEEFPASSMHWLQKEVTQWGKCLTFMHKEMITPVSVRERMLQLETNA
jgi:hypothetical protein